MFFQILFPIKLLHVGIKRITEEVKKLCYMKAKIYENYVKNGRSDANKDELVRISSLSSDSITKAKENYLHSLGNKLNDPQTGAKSYWSILNRLRQKNKIPLIPPILSNGAFITNVYEKITLFNTSLLINVLRLTTVVHYPNLNAKLIVKLKMSLFLNLKLYPSSDH